MINLIYMCYYIYSCCRIGFGVARRLGQEGAKVVVSSRKAARVENATQKLKDEGLEVYGTVCNVGKPEDRERLVQEVILSLVWPVIFEAHNFWYKYINDFILSGRGVTGLLLYWLLSV